MSIKEYILHWYCKGHTVNFIKHKVRHNLKYMIKVNEIRAVIQDYENKLLNAPPAYFGHKSEPYYQTEAEMTYKAPKWQELSIEEKELLCQK
jgi:hypothetical protein